MIRWEILNVSDITEMYDNVNAGETTTSTILYLGKLKIWERATKDIVTTSKSVSKKKNIGF